jgi:hypothetical protein
MSPVLGLRRLTQETQVPGAERHGRGLETCPGAAALGIPDLSRSVAPMESCRDALVSVGAVSASATKTRQIKNTSEHRRRTCRIRVDEIAFHHALAGGYRMRTTMRPIERISMFACVAPDLRDAGCCRSGRRRPAEMPVDREKF